MVQVLATIFFCAAAMSALGVIVTTIAEDFAAMKIALGLARPLPAPHPARVRVRRVDAARIAATALSGPPLRAAA